jgi:hypothetical protein
MKLIFVETNFVDYSLQSHTHPGLAVYPCSDHEDYDTGTASTTYKDLQTPILEGLLCRAEARVEHCHDQSGKLAKERLTSVVTNWSCWYMSRCLDRSPPGL